MKNEIIKKKKNMMINPLILCLGKMRWKSPRKMFVLTPQHNIHT